jgi:hypothetical protein
LSTGWLVVLLFALGIWGAALVTGFFLSRRGSWSAAPAVDLIGAWCGTVAAVALLLGRAGGFRFAWAGALLLVAMMVAAGLYDRAVVMPSLEAAHKRLEHGGNDPKFERDRAFLRRLSATIHVASLLGVIGAAACGILA